MLSPNKTFANMMKNAFKETRTVTLVRHGATKLNNDDVSVDRIRGHKDIPLSQEGREEAKKLAQKMKKNPPDVIVSSKLERAADTAKEISKATGVPIKETSRAFMPWDVGHLTGEKTEKAIPILAHYAEKEPNKPLPGGESFNDFKMRFLNGVGDALKKYKGKIAIVAHHRNERLLHAWAKAGYPMNGDIDIKTFNQKGEHTASAQDFKVPKV